MSDDRWSRFVGELEAAGVLFSAALSDDELNGIEGEFKFRFPPDLRAFLKTGLPRGAAFPDWRNGDPSLMHNWLAKPLEGLLFDVEENFFWLPEWGPRPPSEEERRAIVEERVAQAPVLIPIYAHRKMPDRPHAAGNPVLSVHQTDIIYYGFDLEDYFRHEFHIEGRKPWPQDLQPVEFWDVDRWQDMQ